MAKRGTSRTRGGVRRKNDDFASDVIEIFSRTPIFVPMVAAAGVWLVCALTLRSVPVLGPILALLILLTGVRGWVERRRRGRILGRARTIAGIQGLSWRDFEDLLVELFRCEGYRVEKTAAGTDGGIDHILKRDGETTYVQAKHWNARQVPLAVVQQTYGVATAGRAGRALVVTCGSFSPAAAAFAADISPELDLVDGDALLARLAEHGLADRIAQPHLMAHASLPAVTDESCPRCGAEMQVKRGRYGRFLSCVRYPACRGSRPIAAS